MKGSDSNLSTGVVQAVEALADDAVDWVTNEMRRRGDAVSLVSGSSHRFVAGRHLRAYVEPLTAALSTPTTEYFEDYVRWLSVVLKSRGVPIQIVDQALELLLKFFEGHLSPAAMAPVAKMLNAGRSTLSGEIERVHSLYHTQLPEALPEVEALTPSLLRGDIAAARTLAMTLRNRGWDYVRIATRLFQPALYKIGLFWQKNQITVAQEHLATAISQNILAQLYVTATPAPPLGRKALFAAVERNEHALGLRMVRDAFELAGWTVQYLGGSTPADALLAQIDAWRPELVGLSASLVQHLSDLKLTTKCLRAEFGSACPFVLVGGLPLNQIDGIWRWIGADAWSPNAEKAIAQTK